MRSPAWSRSGFDGSPVPLGFFLELGQAPGRAEPEGAAVMHRLVSGGQRVDRHAAHLVGCEDDSRLLNWSGACPTVSARSDDVRQSEECDLLLRGAAYLAWGGLDTRDGVLVETPPKQSLARRRGAARARDEAHSQVGMAQRRLQSFLVVLSHRGDHRVAVSRRDLERPDLGLAYGAGSKASQLREPDHGVRCRAFPKHQEQRLRQSRLDEDVEGPAAGTCRRDHQLAVLSRLLDLIATDDVNELGRAFGQRAQRLAAHDRLRAAAADPAAQAAVGGDDRLVAGPGGGWRLDAHDRRQHARYAVGRVLPKQLQNVVGYSVTPFDRRAAQTLSEVTGMSMLVIPYGERASITALTYAAGEPTVADSPTPLAPSG